ncbi:MAG: type I 3-dehydroquinate dehydratase [Planctomycetaceae bacterium]
MICVTVTPTSRTFAKVDLLNAASQGDIIELCLDHLAKEPDVKDLISTVSKPIIVSCRRPQDGGKWVGSEEQRLMLLRQAIIAGPSFIELDLDIAPKIPRFGSVKRVISFTRLDRPELDVDAIFDEAANHHADVIKFTWPTPTIDDAWPLLAAVSGKRRLPVVGMGLGRPELTFSLLGRKYGSPWIYAALEQGMEAHEGQATVFDLNEIYHCREIDRKTQFVAIAGFGDSQVATTRVLNAAFKQIDMNVRCLPIQPGDIKQLKKMLDALKVKAILVRGGLGKNILPLADHVEQSDRDSQFIDLLLNKSDGWHGFNTTWRAGLKTLEAKLGTGEKGERPLSRRNVLVLGNGGIAQSLVYAVAQRQGLVSICGPDDADAQRIAAANNCRYVPYQNLYDTLADVIVLADGRLRAGQSQGSINGSLLKSSHTVLDVSDPPLENSLFTEARERGCRLVEPTAVFREQLKTQFKAITAQDLPTEAFESLET